jgi:hypothetical protein
MTSVYCIKPSRTQFNLLGRQQYAKREWVNPQVTLRFDFLAATRVPAIIPLQSKVSKTAVPFGLHELRGRSTDADRLYQRQALERCALLSIGGCGCGVQISAVKKNNIYQGKTNAASLRPPSSLSPTKFPDLAIASTSQELLFRTYCPPPADVFLLYTIFLMYIVLPPYTRYTSAAKIVVANLSFHPFCTAAHK